jgi:hypothetical protein
MSSILNRRFTAVLVTAAAALSGGCAANRYCASPQAYEYAASVPRIVSTDNTVITYSPDAFTIPPPPDNPIPFGRKVPRPGHPGDTQWSCLDQPPPLPAPASAPTAAPAPAAGG